MALERLERRSMLAFSDMATIADSLRLAEDALPQIPGLDASMAQMLPARLSDILGLDAYGNGANTWSGFDTAYPSPSVADVQAVANAIVQNSPWTTTVLPSTANLSASAGHALNSSTNVWIDGFGTNGSGWNIVNGLGNTSSIANNVLTFTNAQSMYNGIWYDTPLSGLASSAWTASFVYTNESAALTDGGSFMIQTAGTSFTGQGWYGSGQSPALRLSWNNFNGGSGGTYLAVTTGSASPSFVHAVGAINLFNSSTPGTFVLSYDGSSTLTVTLTQGSNTATFSQAVNLTGLDANATVGFVGGDGAAGATTTISEFRLVPTLNPSAQQTPQQQFASLPTNINLGALTTTKAFTIQAWFNSSNIAANWQRIIDFGAAQGIGNHNVILGINGSKLFLTTEGTNHYSSSTALSSNTWYHVSAVVDDTTARLYLNGTLTDTFSVAYPANVVPQFNWWGRSNWSGDPAWQGQQDELRIWSRALSAAEIAANYRVSLQGSQSGLLAYYRADDTSGTSLIDASGSGNTATRMAVYGAGSAAFPLGTTVDTAPGQIYINYGVEYTASNPPVALTASGITAGNMITPLLFAVGGSSASPTYTLVASSASIQPPSGAQTFPLNFGLSYAASTRYVVGFTDRQMTGSGTSFSTSSQPANAGFETPGQGSNNYSYGTAGGSWTFSPSSGAPGNAPAGSGIAANGSPWFAPPAPEGTQAAFVQGDGSVIQSFTVSQAGTYAVAFGAVARAGESANTITVKLDGNTISTVPASLLSTAAWNTFFTSSVSLAAGSHTLEFVGNFSGNSDVDSAIDAVSLAFTGTVPWSQSGTSAGWTITPGNFSGNPTVGMVFGAGESGRFETQDLLRSYSINVTAGVPDTAASSLPGLLAQNGAVVTWSPSGTYDSVFSTGGLDAGLKLRKGSSGTIPVQASGLLQLTLAVDASNDLLTGLQANWSASASETGLNLDVGLGYLDTTIQGGSYTLANTTATATLVAPGGSSSSGGGTTATSATVTLADAFLTASAGQFQDSGQITVAATMPFAGEVGGAALPTGSSAPTASLAQSTGSWTSSTSYAQPLWTLSNMGDYLALAQLDVSALVARGLANAGGSLSGLDQSSWLTVPFSNDTVAYDWGAGLSGPAGLLVDSVESIAAVNRITGWLPENDYGATFVITRGTTSTPFTLQGNLADVSSSINSTSRLLAAPIAYYLAGRLAGSGLSCREKPGHPGYLEFYATDPTIDSFTMTPLNTVAGSTAANAFAALGFFAEQNAAVQLQNGSFEGPYAGTSATPWAYAPTGGQWVFTGDAGLAQNGSPWFGPAAPDGTQAAFLQETGSIAQTLYDVDAGTYQLSFSAIQRTDYPADAFNVVVDGETVMTVTGSQLTTNGWTQFTTPAFSLAAGNHTIEFQGLGDDGEDVDSAIDAVVLVSETLVSQTSYQPSFSTLSGMLQVLNQGTVIGTAATPSPIQLPGSNAAVGQVSIATGTTYTAAEMPAAIQFVANVPGQSITPLVFSVSGSTYTLVAAGQSIAVTRSGLQTWPLVLPAFTPSSSATYVLGFTDRSMSVSASSISTVASTAGTIGADVTTGNWLVTTTLPSSAGSSLALNTVFGGSSGTALVSGGTYAFAGFTGVTQAGSGSVTRPDTSTSTGTYVFTGAAYTTAFLPTGVRFYAKATGSITPLLLEYSSGSTYTVAASSQAITVTETGLNESSVSFSTSGLTPGRTYLLGFQNRGTGVVAMGSSPSATGGWISAATTSQLTAGSSASFSAAAICSLDVLTAATAAANPSSLTSVQYDVAYDVPPGQPAAYQIRVSYADISTSDGEIEIEAEAISDLAIPGITDLTLSGAEDVPVTMTATRQFTLLLDASVMTSGASLANRQQQATAGLPTNTAGQPLMTGVLTAIGVTPGIQVFGVAGYVSNVINVAAGTQVYSTAPTVTITDAGGTGSGATAVANLDPNTNTLQSVTLLTPGSNYTAPVFSVSGNDPATAVARLSAGGISGAQIVSGGRYYAAPPTVTITDRTGAGRGATATATISGGVVTAITITNAGSGYVRPVITIAPPTIVTGMAMPLVPVPTVTISDPNGVGATGTVLTDANGLVTGILVGSNQATATATVSNGVVSGIAVTAGGATYASAPSVTITDASGSGSGATATATIANGVVTGITITAGGSGYVSPVVTIGLPAVVNSGYSLTTPPTVTFSVPGTPGFNAAATATATASGGVVTGITITSPGQFYGSTAPLVTITDAGGQGSGATATATVLNGAITAITLNAGGAGYVSPQVTISAPLTAAAVVTGGVNLVEVINPGVLYQATPIVTISDSAGNGTGATATAVMEGGQIVDIVVTSYGSGYLSPVVTIAPPTVDIAATPQGPSSLAHVFYFTDGSSWTTTTSSFSGISLQYQLIDQLTTLDDSASVGLTGGNGSTTAGYYNLQAYLNPLLSDSAPTTALTANLAIMMPTATNAPLLWYVSAPSNDPFLGQALFPNATWSVATLGVVTLGNVDLLMNMTGSSAAPGFTGTAQVGYLDVSLTAEDFTPDVEFTLSTTPDTFNSFGTWQTILTSDELLDQNATTSAQITSYELALSAAVSGQVQSLIGGQFTGVPGITVDAAGANEVFTGTFVAANWGGAEGLLYIDAADVGAAFETVSTALAATDEAGTLGSLLPFVGDTLQELTGFSDTFVEQIQTDLVTDVPADLDALLDALGIDRCVVVGWSMGSLVAWEMMHRHGRDRIAGHVVLSQGPTDLQGDDFPDAPLTLEAIHGFVAGVQADFAGAIGGFAPAMFKEPLSDEDVAWCVAESTMLGPNAASSILLHQTLYDARAAIASGAVPTLLIWGTDEKLIPVSMGHWCAANIPGAELHVFEDSGHCPQLEEPARTAAAIADWAAALP